MAALKPASVVAVLPARSPILVWGISLQIGFIFTLRFQGECQIARLRLASDSEFFVNPVSLQTFGLDLQLQICQELYDLVHWIRPRKGPDTKSRQSRKTEEERLH